MSALAITALAAGSVATVAVTALLVGALVLSKRGYVFTWTHTVRVSLPPQKSSSSAASASGPAQAPAAVSAARRSA